MVRLHLYARHLCHRYSWVEHDWTMHALAFQGSGWLVTVEMQATFGVFNL
jgi:hypothetical protein